MWFMTTLTKKQENKNGNNRYSKGEFVNNPSGNNIGGARFVHCVATGGTQSVIVKDSGGTTIGNIYLHATTIQSSLRKF